MLSDDYVSHSDVILHRFSYFVLTTLLWSKCYYYCSFMHKNTEHSSVTFPWLSRPRVCGKSIQRDSQLLKPEVPFHCSSMKKSKTEVLFSLGLVSYASFFPRRKMKSFDSSLKWKSQCFLCVFSSVDFQILVYQQALSSFKICPEPHQLSSPLPLALCTRHPSSH